ncbi:hypothetical protein BDV06DRAFT_200755 [Aspergillus oleicola]
MLRTIMLLGDSGGTGDHGSSALETGVRTVSFLTSSFSSMGGCGPCSSHSARQGATTYF